MDYAQQLYFKNKCLNKPFTSKVYLIYKETEGQVGSGTQNTLLVFSQYMSSYVNPLLHSAA